MRPTQDLYRPHNPTSLQASRASTASNKLILKSPEESPRDESIPLDPVLVEKRSLVTDNIILEESPQNDLSAQTSETSGLSSLVDVSQSKDSDMVPPWAWGAGAGGLAALTATGIVVGHVVAKKRRQKQAEERARDTIIEYDAQGTPRKIYLV